MRPSSGSPEGGDRLRLDLYLKRSRLVKRRSLAASMCSNGWVELNGREAPPGRTVKVGDRITLQFPRTVLLVEVTAIPGRGALREPCFRQLEQLQREEEPF